jgi:hypothetical protein
MACPGFAQTALPRVQMQRLRIRQAVSPFLTNNTHLHGRINAFLDPAAPNPQPASQSTVIQVCPSNLFYNPKLAILTKVQSKWPRLTGPQV